MIKRRHIGNCYKADPAYGKGVADALGLSIDEAKQIGCYCYMKGVDLMSEKREFTAEQAKNIGEKLGIIWDKFDVEQFRMGMDVELEHGIRDPHTNVTNDDPLTTGKIALAHLNEFPDYYTRLDKMEEEAEEFWEHK